jgi:hypothetical protein
VDKGTPSGLRDYLRQMRDKNFAVLLDILWRLSQPIHDRQNYPDSNENGRVHVKMVEQNIWRLMYESHNSTSGERNLYGFVPPELFLLSAAACCHDFDKAIKNSLPLGFAHGQGSAEFVRKNHERLGLGRPEADAVALAINIHDLKVDGFQRELRRLRPQHQTSYGPVNMQRVAILLKTADILHTDFSRISTLATNAKGLRGIKRKKYLARYCIDGWGIDGSRVLIQAAPRNREQRDALREAFDYIRRNEWVSIAEDLHRFGFPYELYLDEGGAIIESTRNTYGETQIRTSSLEAGRDARVHVQVLIEGDLSRFDDDARKDFIAKLSLLINSAPEQINILGTLQGSIRISLELMESAANRLNEIAAQAPSVLTAIGILKLRIGEDLEKIMVPPGRKNFRDFIEQNWEEIRREITSAFETQDDFLSLLRRADFDTSFLRGDTFANKVDSFIHRCINSEGEEIVRKVFQALAEHSRRGKRIPEVLTLFEQ